MWGSILKAAPRFLGRLFPRRMGKSIFSSLGTKLTSLYKKTGHLSKGMTAASRTKGLQFLKKYPRIAGMASKIKTAYEKSPSWVKSIAGTVGFSLAYDWVFGGDSDDSSEGFNPEDAEAYALVLATKNGTIGLKMHNEGSADKYVSSPSHGDCVSIVKDMLSSSKVILGQPLSGDLDSRLSTMTDNQRIHILGLLANVSKRIADSSEYHGITHAFRLQAASAMELTSYPTRAMSQAINGEHGVSKTSIDAMCLESIAIFNGLLSEVRTDAAQDFFDDNTAFFSGEFDPDLKGLTPFAAHLLTVDMPLSESLSWWQKWKIDDNDPNDDETIVAKLIDNFSRISDQHSDYLIKLCDGRLGYEDGPVL